MSGTTAITPSVTFGGQVGSIPLNYLDTNFTQLTTAFNTFNNFSNYLVDTGTANAIVATAGTSIVTTLAAGLIANIKVLNANTGATTVNLNALGAKNLTFPGGSTALTANTLLAGTIITVFYDGTQFQLIGGANGSSSAYYTNPTITNYTETLYAIGNSSTAVTISLANGTVQTVTLTGNCTFTMPSVGAGKSFILIVSSGAGAFTGTFTSVKWPNNTAPTLTTTATRWDILAFFSDGTNWYGNYVQAFQ